MESSYYQIAHMFSRTQTSAQFDNLFKAPHQGDQRFEDEFFLKIYRELKDKFQVCFKLFGENNFKILVFEYMRNVPYNEDHYGHLFPEFLGHLKSLSELRYIKWIAKLDWFWFADNKTTIQLPKGTLYSWGNLQRDEEDIDIRIDESIMERLVVRKVDNEYRIVSV